MLRIFTHFNTHNLSFQRVCVDDKIERTINKLDVPGSLLRNPEEEEGKDNRVHMYATNIILCNPTQKMEWKSLWTEAIKRTLRVNILGGLVLVSVPL